MNIAPIGTYVHRIIDAHGHTGTFFNGEKCNWSHLLERPLENSDNIDRVIVSNLDGIINNSTLDEIQANKQILSECISNKKFVPLAVCRPDKGNVSNIISLFEQYPARFAGLKFHPNESYLNADSIKYEPYLKFAQQHKLPCVFHCQDNAFSSPESIYASAKKIPDTPVVLAHLCSGDTNAQKKGLDTIVESITKGDAMLYTDISWVDFESVKQDNGTPVIVELIKKLKNHEKGDFTHRIMFGSDAPIAEYSSSAGGEKMYLKFVENIKKSIRNDEQLRNDADSLIDKIFYKNAEELFIKPLNEKTIRDISKNIVEKTPSAFIDHSSKNMKKIPMFTLSIIGIGLVSTILNMYSKKQQVLAQQPDAKVIQKPANETSVIDRKLRLTA